MAKTQSASFAALLKHSRAAAGLTQEELAERASLSARAISDLERGINHRPQAYTIQRLVQALGLDKDEAARFQRTARCLGSASREDGSETSTPASNDADDLIQTARLPRPPTPFIGRQQEIREVAELVRWEDVRLLTLSGPGGVGKTRLALRVAEEMRDAFPDGVLFVSLASLADPALVPTTVAGIAQVKEQSGRPIVESLTEHLQGKRLLLVLDNFEHLLPAGVVVSHLLASCPQLKLLVTSRTILHLAAEHEYPVPPLPVPTPMHLPDLDALSRYDAVQLFVQRAQAIKPDFQLIDESASAIAEICCRLDGLPLAIELAAARIRLFSPQALLARLQSGLELLSGGPRDVPARQQTLHNTIDWSYSLLSPKERTLFARLSVFAGGCTLEAIEEVCNRGREMETLEGTTSLVEQSLLRVEGDEEPRFQMLETVREYASERLEASGEAEEIRRRHARYFLGLVEEISARRAESSRAGGLDRLEREHDNMRAALRWALERERSPDTVLRLAGGLAEFWRDRGHRSEGTCWLKRALVLMGTDRALRADVLEGAARLAFYHGDYGWAIELHEEKLALERELGDSRRIAKALKDFGVLAHHFKNLERATALFEESLALFQELGDAAGIAAARSGLGYVARDRGDYERATRLLEESLDVYRQLQDVGGMYWTLMSLGLTASAQGDYRRATALLEESAALSGDSPNAASLHALGCVAAEHGDDDRATALLQESMDLFGQAEDIGGMVSSLDMLARVALRRDAYDRASSLYKEGLIQLRDVDHRRATIKCLEGLACALTGTGKAEQAARLLGAADRWREVERTEAPSGEDRRCDHDVAQARGLLAPGVWESAWQAGRAMTMEQAVAYALAEAT